MDDDFRSLFIDQRKGSQQHEVGEPCHGSGGGSMQTGGSMLDDCVVGFPYKELSIAWFTDDLPSVFHVRR